MKNSWINFKTSIETKNAILFFSTKNGFLRVPFSYFKDASLEWTTGNGDQDNAILPGIFGTTVCVTGLKVKVTRVILNAWSKLCGPTFRLTYIRLHTFRSVWSKYKRCGPRCGASNLKSENIFSYGLGTGTMCENFQRFPIKCSLGLGRNSQTKISTLY